MTRLNAFLIFFSISILSACETMETVLERSKAGLASLASEQAEAQQASQAAPAPTLVRAPAPSSKIKPNRSDKPLEEFEVTEKSYAEEDINHGTPHVSALIDPSYRGATPTTLAGGKMIATGRLHKMLTGDKRPVVINALQGASTELIPGSVWLSGAGQKGRFDDDIQQRLAQHLSELSGGDKKKALVFYCIGIKCWLSYNAALRAVNAGYRNVLWYRGGLTSWYAAGLPSVRSNDDQW